VRAQYPHILKTLGRAWGWRRKLESGEAATVGDIARAEKVTDRFVSLQGQASAYREQIEALEAAAMDGATRIQIIRLIILPLLKPTTLVIVILSTIHGFQSFDFIYTLTGGGPLGATTLIVQYIYDRAFQSPIQYGHQGYYLGDFSHARTSY
jgi:hypothetical protein